jgi:regulator of sirC expression with transglutaminase-like and TPR domain
VTKKQIVARVLTNLKVLHWKARDFEQALAAVELLFVVRSDDPRELRDRGRLRLWTTRYEEAIQDLEAYLARVPGAEDAAEIRAEIREARQGLAGPR